MIVDRYALAGLTRNPFAIEMHQADPAAVFVDRGLPGPPVLGSPTLVQVIGDRGAGKTTQLHAWRRVASGPYHYVPPAPRRRRWVTPPVAALVYVDEVDRLAGLTRHRWFRALVAARATAVIGTHVDLSRSAARAGLHVVTYQLGPVHPTTLQSIVDRRIDHAAVGTGNDVLRPTRDEVFAVHARSGGSIRQAEVMLHELIAAKVSARY